MAINPNLRDVFLQNGRYPFVIVNSEEQIVKDSDERAVDIVESNFTERKLGESGLILMKQETGDYVLVA